MKRSHSNMSRSLSLVIDRQTSFASNSSNITNNMFTPKCSVDDIENPFVKRLMTRRQARIKTPFEQEIDTDPLLRCCVPLLCLPCRFQSRLLSCLFFLRKAKQNCQHFPQHDCSIVFPVVLTLIVTSALLIHLFLMKRKRGCDLQ